MSIECKWLNGICRLLYWGQYRRFVAPCSVEAVQTDYLLKLLRRNRDTVYGRKYGFRDIKTYEDFVQRVPLTCYEDYEPYIDAAAKGEKHVLTSEKIMLFELTSGSSGGKKKIPYTRSLKREFQRGIKPWLCDLYTNIKGVDSGKSYWSITPVTTKRSYTEAGIPVGFEEDAEYFGFIEQGIMRKIFAVDGSVKFSQDMADFYRKTVRQLLQCSELTLISVWNPTFLTILCDFIGENALEFAELFPEDKREPFLQAAQAGRFDRIFPELKIISCWADGSAADYIAEVEKRFPGVYIQPKGLLATECFISFPMTGEQGSRLSIYSHFFEFRRLSDGRIVTAGDLSTGEYEVIVTTGGGFYRYCIGDIIEVLEVYSDRPPRIRFLHRKGISSDLFGEKLTEEFVRSVCVKLGIAESFCLLAPEGRHYCLYTTALGVTGDMLDKALSEGYHYDYCRKLGQLDKASVIRVGGNPQKEYITRLSKEGMRTGDIKPAYLSRKSGWQHYFEIVEERKGEND
ncbi:MAG: GH3 auxin-responsive promoter family protein [Lachnospiraceae bacterium]|nr:GH3 auxin-responsive promoter family protein [Lachnospiraceae bacterium]